MLHRAKERAQIARLIIGLVRILYRGKFGSAFNMAKGIDTLLLSGAVLIGEVEGHPRTASDVARIIGIPRATALRKLEALIRHGVIRRRGKRYFMNDDHVIENDSYIDEALKLIRCGREKASKMDG